MFSAALNLILHLWAQIRDDLLRLSDWDVSQRSDTWPNVITILAGVVSIGIALAVGFEKREKSAHESGGQENIACKSATETYKHAAVVTDSEQASDIGWDIMDKGGNAMDAAIAALFATGLLSAHSAGIGGGSLYVIYDNAKGWHAVDSRETAPGAATMNMFAAPENRNKSLFGGLAIGVPGEVKGLYEVWKKFGSGKVPWENLVMPSVKLCEEGVPLTNAVFKALDKLREEGKKRFSEYFDVNHNRKPVGSLIKLPILAQTFRKIAKEPLSFYEGSLAQDIVADIQEAGGIITVEDLKKYDVKWRKPSKMMLPGDMTVYSMPPPGSGPVLSYILSILCGNRKVDETRQPLMQLEIPTDQSSYNFSSESVATDEDSILTYHRITEAMKFAFAKRTELGDENFNANVTTDIANMTSLAYGEATRAKIDDSTTHETAYYNPTFSMSNDQGTAHISVIDAEGNAVSVTSTINTYFGSQVKGKRTGIVFNNQMDDFSTPNTTNYFKLPASPANFITPGKRPMSSMCPTIVWDERKRKVRLVTGASGGSMITSAIALNIMDVLWFGMSLGDSVDRPRLHHQLMPEAIQVEKGYPEAILNGLRGKGHTTEPMTAWAVVQAVDVLQNGVVGVADFRKGGKPSGY